MKRNTLLIVVIAVIALVFIFNPFQMFTGGGKTVARPAVDKNTLAGLLSYAQSSWKSPEDFVVSAFADHDIVFLGEFYKIRQHVQLVSALIPRLYAAGVRSLGIEYALSDEQAEVDALLTAPVWDESKARAVTFDWLGIWAFQEYIDIYKAAWQLNRSLPQGAKPFRIVALNVRQNWEVITSDKDARDPAKIAQLYARGIPDVHMAEVIGRQFIDTHEKALVFCHMQHAFTRYRSAEYTRNAQAMKLAETRKTGNIVFDRIGARAFTIALHAPWPDRLSRVRHAWPAEGVIDALIDALPADKRRAGYPLAGTPLGAVAVTSGSYAGTDTPNVGSLFDGYVILGPMADYTAVTQIPDFITAQNVQQAAREFPGPKTSSPTVADVTRSILDEIKGLERLLAQFK